MKSDLVNTIPSRIYIIGMPGSGKSTWGKKLAAKLGYTFVDTDLAIEQRESKSIDTIFKELGETVFRELEQKFLHQTLSVSNTVFACGGGMPCHHNNIEWMNSHGFTLWFDAPIGLLEQRLQSGLASRPLFHERAAGGLNGFLNELFHSRKVFYQQAKARITMPVSSSESLVQQVLSAFYIS